MHSLPQNIILIIERIPNHEGNSIVRGKRHPPFYPMTGHTFDLVMSGNTWEGGTCMSTIRRTIFFTSLRTWVSTSICSTS